MFAGGVSLLEVLFFMISSLVGSFVISKGISYMVKKYNRPSFVLYCLVGVIGISLVVMPIFGIYKSVENPDEMLAFRDVC